MITGYSNQHFSIKEILNTHWGILKNDKIIGPIIPDHPVVIYRGAPSLRHNSAPNIENPPPENNLILSIYERFFSPVENVAFVRSTPSEDENERLFNLLKSDV